MKNESHEGLGAKESWPIKELWEKYEDIAMHFNDLIIKLRTQALGGVAAISALIGIFGKASSENRLGWEVATLVFVFLILFWIAIWAIDFLYYNRLLLGAVDAILEIENESKKSSKINYINLSSKIEEAVAGNNKIYHLKKCSRFRLGIGRWVFYIIVLIALFIGLICSIYEYVNSPR